MQVTPSFKSDIQMLLDRADGAIQKNMVSRAWFYLEEAHILSQPFAGWHLRVHLAMLLLAVRIYDWQEIWGQILRLILAAPGSILGRYPVGNTGRSNVSMFLPMAIPPHLSERMNIFLRSNSNSRSKLMLISAFLYTFATLWLGYRAFGLLTSLIFSSGFLGGFILWCCIRSNTPYEKIKVPYYLCLILFVIHRVEEKYAGFFSFLSKVTNVPTPEILSWEIVGLVMISVGSWLSIPYLLSRRREFGYYFLWTFFAAMGITELAHIVVFPVLIDKPYGYIPGMWSVIPLAPLAWWGMVRLSRRS